MSSFTAIIIDVLTEYPLVGILLAGMVIDIAINFR